MLDSLPLSLLEAKLVGVMNEYGHFCGKWKCDSCYCYQMINASVDCKVLKYL